jgi:hypothetical protein
LAEQGKGKRSEYTVAQNRIPAQESNAQQDRSSKKEKIVNTMKGADPYYIDKYVESLHFLDAEIKKWQKLVPRRRE